MAEPYQKGEYVSYSCSGVCRVEDIRTDPSDPHGKTFYILRPISDPGSTIFVPVDSAVLLAKIQPLPSQEEIDDLLLSTCQDNMVWEENRKLRAAQFQVIIKSCDLRELLRLVSCIYRQRQTLTDSGKKLPSSDEAVLHRAESLIENKLSFVLHLSEDQVGPYIRQKLSLQV